MVGTVIGLAASVIATGLTLGHLATGADRPSVAVTDVLAAAAGSTFYTAVSATIGGAIGALTRNQVAAAIAMIVYLSMIDPLVGTAVADYGQFGPTALGIALGGAGPDPNGGPGAQLLPPLVAGPVWLGYAILLVAAAHIATTRRDL